MKKTIIYIDGFNLYYSLKNTSFKWLNLQRFSAAHLDPKKHNITRTKYFTARVQSTLTDPLKDTRQDIYLRAVKTLPNIEIIFGQFKKRQVRGVLCDSEDRKVLKEQ